VFVGNLSWNADEDMVAAHFAECGEVLAVRIITDQESGRKKGFGYVEFADAESAKNALKMHETELDGRAIRVDLSIQKERAEKKSFNNKNSFTPSAPTSAPADTLFVGNMSFNAHVDGLKELFGEYGNVTSVRIPTDRETGAVKGFGYVSFSSVDEAKAALEALNGVDYEGRGLRLDYSTPRDNAGGAGGARGGRGGGRGGFGGDRGG
ncbi:hypothetical protein BCR33DRAFT_629022, partial [Rhizoclosmatium globosum]